jgi:hypothetical protein
MDNKHEREREQYLDIRKKLLNTDKNDIYTLIGICSPYTVANVKRCIAMTMPEWLQFRSSTGIQSHTLELICASIEYIQSVALKRHGIFHQRQLNLLINLNPWTVPASQCRVCGKKYDNEENRNIIKCDCGVAMECKDCKNDIEKKELVQLLYSRHAKICRLNITLKNHVSQLLTNGRQICIICFKTLETNTCCSKCKKVYYCCKEHQQLDWKNIHRSECKELCTRQENKSV